MKSLDEVLLGVSYIEIQNPKTTIFISDIEINSQKVKEGTLFIAKEGTNFDGHDYIFDAISRGATAIVYSKKYSKLHAKQIVIPPSVCGILVSQNDDVISKIVSNFFDHISSKKKIIGITGTNGKTTTTYIIESILSKANLPNGILGTINYRWMGKEVTAPNTTPDRLLFERAVSNMSKDGVEYIVTEVSSHALEQKRVDGILFDIAVFTNLTRDHLDYHIDMENYFLAKARLFSEILPSKPNSVAVINIGDEYGFRLKELSKYSRTILYSSNHENYKLNDNLPNDDRLLHTKLDESTDNFLPLFPDVYPIESKFSLEGINATIQTPNGVLQISSQLIGRHNLENILASISVCIALSISNQDITDGIANIKYVPGRLEPIPNNKEKFVFIDYAHTDDALNRVLLSLKSIESNSRIICVVGCGGDRDHGKRKLMGAIAGKNANITIITNDNPRGESPIFIANEIALGASLNAKLCEELELKAIFEQLESQKECINKESGNYYMICLDRKEAIKKAISFARPHDIVLIAGKGHEKYQIIGKEKLDFDDYEVAKNSF